MAAEIGNTFQFTREVNGFFPAGNFFSRVVADVANAEEFVFGGGKNFGCLTEMFDERAGAHRPDAFNEVQSDECFPRIHARIKRFQACGFKFQVRQTENLKLGT